LKSIWYCRNPTFWKSVRMTLTLPKWGLGSPQGLLKLQNSIAGVKTPYFEAFLISLESYQNVDVKNGLAWAIWTSASQKERSGVKLSVWLPTTRSWELTRPRCVQVECDTLLESPQGELRVCFRPHPNRRFEQRVMNSQSPGSTNRNNFGTLPWESWDKKPFRCRCCRET